MDAQNPSASSDALSPRKRRRTKLACEPCRTRKRKCNGNLPCETCSQFEYDCYYVTAKSKRKSSTQNIPEQVHRSPLSSDQPVVASPSQRHNKEPQRPLSRGTSAEEGDVQSTRRTPDDPINGNSHLESLEANSGAAFVRRLGLKIDPSNAPRLHLFAWNAGDRLAGCPTGTPRNVTSILTEAEIRALALIYFEKVAYAYGFIDWDIFFQRLEERWKTPTRDSTYDPVLCGVAALGLLFSQKFPTIIEPDLVESARTLLEQHSLSMPPSIDTVTGWVLRVAYLRMSSLPHMTWLASCSLMHVAEAAGIHLETPSRTILNASSETIDLDTRRRLWGMAQHLHIWASFDLGRTNITLSGATTKPVEPKRGDYTSQLLGLIPFTESLDPNKARSVEDLEADMNRVLAEERSEPPVVMAQVNLMLCIFRRLRAQKSNMLNLQAGRILAVATKGLQAARRMAAAGTPWHHVANVPFQVVCLALAIDSRASLALVGEAMRTLQLVANSWSNAVLREAYNTAYLLVMLHQRRKEEDAKTLRDVLSMHSTTAPAITSDSSAYQFNGSGTSNSHGQSGFQQQMPATSAPATATNESMEFLWLEDLIADMPSLREFDLEQFLVQDATQPQYTGDVETGLAQNTFL